MEQTAEQSFCPECEVGYSDKHSKAAIKQYGKCTDCLGHCPYCMEAELAEIDL